MKMIIANFKSNKSKSEIDEWIQGFMPTSTSKQRQATIVLCPPMPYLTTFFPLLQENIKLGVQDISMYPSGSYTGAISSHNLEGLDVTYAIVGHSERRSHFHETSTDVANKVRECLSAHIVPIVCVTKDEINATANILDEHERKQCIVAFEPIEHIGTGESDTLTHILETKNWVRTAFGNVPYIYGGSVNPSTDLTILQSDQIDGFLVGSASLDPKKFRSLIEKTA